MVMIRILIILFLLGTPVFAQETVQGPVGPIGPPGRGVDEPEVDPTDAVRALVEANRQADIKLREVEQSYLSVIRGLEDRIASANILRLDQTRELQARLASAELSKLERQADLDREAVAEANRAAVETAKDLALRVQQSAEVLSGQVATAAGTATENLTRLEARIVASISAIDGRLVGLEQFQNQEFGQARVADPQLLELKALVATLVQAQATGTGRDTGASNTIIFIAMAISALGVLMGVAGAIVAFVRQPRIIHQNGDSPTVTRK